MVTVFRSTDEAIPVGTHCWLHNDDKVPNGIVGWASAPAEGQRPSCLEVGCADGGHGGPPHYAAHPSPICLDDMRAALHTGRSGTRCYITVGGEVEAFLEALQPPPTLAIFGAGYDALPVAQGAKNLGWRVTVADHRPAYATAERFPSADVVVLATAPASVERMALDARSCALLMTHNYLLDLELLPHLLLSPARYIGVLGPQSRAERLLSDLDRQGWTFSAAQLARLHAPVGLDIGAETPAEIALSILAEIQSVLARRQGGTLRKRPVPIHEPSSDV